MFGIESKFYRTTTIIFRVVLANLLFLLTSLLILTIPASFSALFYTLSSGEMSVGKKYFQQFRRALLNTIPLGIVNVFSFLTMLSLVNGFQTKTFLVRLLIVICCLFLLIFNLSMYLIQNESEKQVYFQIFRNAFIWTVMAFPKIVLAAFVIAPAFYFAERYFVNSLLFFGIGTIVFSIQAIYFSSMRQIQKEK